VRAIDIVVGFDQREAVAYHVFCQSVLEKSSKPVRFIRWLGILCLGTESSILTGVTRLPIRASSALV